MCFFFRGPEEMTIFTALPTALVAPDFGLVEITEPLGTVFDSLCLILPILQFKAGITTLATASGVPASLTTLHDGAALAALTLSSWLAELFDGFGSLIAPATDAEFVYTPVVAPWTAILTVVGRWVRKQLTSCPAIVHELPSAEATTGTRPVGTGSVNVPVLAGVEVTAKLRLARSPAVIALGDADPDIPTSTLWRRLTLTLTRPLGKVVDATSVAPLAGDDAMPAVTMSDEDADGKAQRVVDPPV